MILILIYKKILLTHKVDLSGNELHGSIRNCELHEGEIKIPYTVLPHRVPGRLKCLPHKDEGLVKDEHGNDKWGKGRNHTRNERRYVLQMRNKVNGIINQMV